MRKMLTLFILAAGLASCAPDFAFAAFSSCKPVEANAFISSAMERAPKGSGSLVGMEAAQFGYEAGFPSLILAAFLVDTGKLLSVVFLRSDGFTGECFIQSDESPQVTAAVRHAFGTGI